MVDVEDRRHPLQLVSSVASLWSCIIAMVLLLTATEASTRSDADS